MDGWEQRHRELIERDRWVGLEAEADAARAHADRLQQKLDVARMRLERKNARIKQLSRQLRELEAKPSGLRDRLRRRGPAS